MTLGEFQKALADLKSGTCTEVSRRASRTTGREPLLETIETALRGLITPSSWRPNRTGHGSKCGSKPSLAALKSLFY